MKRQFQHGFLAGLLTAGLLMVLGVTALAVSRTITVDDGIRITFNGAAFTPRDANGRAVELFTYNGTTYAPLRALCEAAGLKVSYDSATRTAQVSSPGGTPAPSTTPAPATGNYAYITAEQAKGFALAHAGVKASDVTFIKAEFDWDGGIAEYEVEFYAGSTEYDYDIDAVTGEVRSFDHDVEGWQPAASGNSGTITSERARELAVKYASDRGIKTAAVVKCKLDWDDGRQIYELELRGGNTEYECKIDASSGAVLAWEID